MRALVLAFALASPSVAADQPPLCPDSKAPRFSGDPILAFACPGDPQLPAKGSGRGLVSEADLPPLEPAALEPLLGRWQGWLTRGNQHFELALSVEKRAGGARLRFSALSRNSYRRHRIEAALSEPFWSRKSWIARVTLLDLGQALDGRAWLGPAAPPVVNGLDRAFALAFDRVAVAHTVRFKAAPDKIDYEWTLRRKGAPPERIVGSLTRSDKEPW